MAGYFNAHFFEKQLGESPGRHAPGGFPRTRAFEDVSKIVRVVLQPAREVSVARPRTRELPGAFLVGELARLNSHHLLPVLEVPVANQQRNRRADGLAVSHAADDLDFIGFDLHPSPAPVALLPPP